MFSFLLLVDSSPLVNYRVFSLFFLSSSYGFGPTGFFGFLPPFSSLSIVHVFNILLVLIKYLFCGFIILFEFSNVYQFGIRAEVPWGSS